MEVNQMNKDEALRHALEALENIDRAMPFPLVKLAIEECKAALKTKDEPVAWMVWGHDNVPSLTFTKPADKYVFYSLYMIPPQRTWVGLTEQEIERTYMDTINFQENARILEDILKEKNI